MRKLFIAAVAATAIAPAVNAGGYVEPQMPPVVIIDDTAASNQGIFVPAFAILLLIMLHHN